jgi:hypothetical protein
MMSVEWLQIGLDSQAEQNIPLQYYSDWIRLELLDRWQAFANLLKGWNGGVDPPMDKTMLRIMSIEEGQQEDNLIDEFMVNLRPEHVSPDCIGEFVKRTREMKDAIK